MKKFLIRRHAPDPALQWTSVAEIENVLDETTCIGRLVWSDAPHSWLDEYSPSQLYYFRAGVIDLREAESLEDLMGKYVEYFL